MWEEIRFVAIRGPVVASENMVEPRDASLGSNEQPAEPLSTQMRPQSAAS